jgi:O-acetylserine/cysteine efflux transporter
MVPVSAKGAAPSPSGALPWTHAALAVAVMAVWGINFVFIKVAEDVMPPLLLAALRFTFALVPAVFFIKRPAVPLIRLAGYGLLIGVSQFGLLYTAIDGHISPGLASLVVQTQVFCTIGLSMVIMRERLLPIQGLALALAVAGIGILIAHVDKTTTVLGLVLTIGAAMSWAGGNLVAKSSPGVNMLAYVVWSSLFAAPPLLALSLVFEGWPVINHALHAATVVTWAAVLWQSGANTLFGYTAWGWLLARHPAASVTPMALLVPVFGMGASALMLGEGLPLWKLLAAALVLSGLGLNLLWPSLAKRFAQPDADPG